MSRPPGRLHRETASARLARQRSAAQPAEGRAREMAESRLAAATPGRANPGGRCSCPGGNSPADTPSSRWWNVCRIRGGGFRRGSQGCRQSDCHHRRCHVGRAKRLRSEPERIAGPLSRPTNIDPARMTRWMKTNQSVTTHDQADQPTPTVTQAASPDPEPDGTRGSVFAGLTVGRDHHPPVPTHRLGCLDHRVPGFTSRIRS